MATAVSHNPMADGSLLGPLSHSNLLVNGNIHVQHAVTEDDEDSVASDGEGLNATVADNPDTLKRSAQDSAFHDHLHKRQEERLIEANKPNAYDGDTPGNSVYQSARIIDTVREYQQELFERAKEENVIAVLDTGSGKTLIACLLIRHVLEHEEKRRADGEMPKFIFFLANSVHLVDQQGEVLKSNLADEPLVLHGSSKYDLWKRETWDKIKKKFKVLVCTAAILDQCLMHSYVTMEEISLLVFDEAHHAKKDHPYSRIIRSYYIKCTNDMRPKIFGMTASAVDTKGDIATTAKNLEELLHAKIITTLDDKLLAFAPKPEDVEWTYSRLKPSFDTDLHGELSAKVNFIQDLKQGFTFSTFAIKELGPWCADRAWVHVLGNSPQASSKIRQKFENSKYYETLSTVEEREQSISALEEAASRIQSCAFRTPQVDRNDLSSKVIHLHDKLKERYKNYPDTRAIVFVEQRLTALVLNDCFNGLKIPNVRHGVLLGLAGNSYATRTLKEEQQILLRFRAGLLNLVFATSVADEGLDIPQCNLCVRFDLCKTTIQYMQSKGRARMPGSTFAHMIEDGNWLQSAERKYQIDNEEYIKNWCGTLDPSRRLGKGTQLAKLLSRDAKDYCFKTKTGVICDSSNAMLILSRFATSLNTDGRGSMVFYEEEIDVEKNLFRYTIRLPRADECTFRGAKGTWKQNKQLAKRSAAYACCKYLRSKKYLYLNDNLDSIFKKSKPENANALLAVSAKKSSYEMQIKPLVWEQGINTNPDRLHATVLRFRPERTLKHTLASIVVLSRTALPVMPSFTAYLEKTVRVEVTPERIEHSFPTSEDQIHKLTTFTLQAVFSDVFNKVYAFEPLKMSYWLAPLMSLPIGNKATARTLEDLVCFSNITLASQDRISWKTGMSAELWTNKFLCDPWNGKFHYFTSDIADGVKITDPVPDNIPKISQKKRQNIIDFSNSLWTASKKNLHDKAVYDLEQPVLKADLVGTRRNFLDSAAAEDLITCLIAPQMLQISRITPEVAASCLLWPALIHRIESYMIVLEAFDKLALPGVSAALALEAFTKDADNETEEVQTHTGNKRGMGKNYERLEFIGDSLLKMTSTMTVFNRTTCDEEGMHVRRMEMLCNRNLFNVATSDDLQLYKYARTLGFDRATWYPEHLTLLQGRGAQKDAGPITHTSKSQDLGMKTVADMSEAIIGAAITTSTHMSIHEDRFNLGIQAISRLVRSEDHAVESWADIAAQYKAPEWSLLKNDPIANNKARVVAEKTGYSFKYPRLLRSAFTHSSDSNAPVPDLQRLEFLGDAVLDWVCISWLFDTNPTRNPQWLTEHKMAMVSNKFLAALAVTLDFDKLAFITTTKLLADITTYAVKVREARSKTDCPPNFWVEIEAPPKALSDLVESYLGAVLIDSGFNYKEMENFFERHIKPFFTNLSDYDSFANRQPTTYLYHKLGQDFRCRDFAIKDNAEAANEASNQPQILAGVLIHGKIVADDSGVGVRYVRVRASKKALSLLEGLTRQEYREKFGCNCTSRDD